MTQELLRHWASDRRPRRLFFCQREAVETIIYLAELRIPGKSSRTGFKNFELIPKNTFYIVPKQFEPGVELTRTYKLRRTVIKEIFAEQIEGMYR